VACCALLFFIAKVHAQSGPLPSWNNGAAKQSIVEFVGKVTKSGSPDFVPPADRIAAFDNDGTLWCEKPFYIHVEAVMARYKEQITANPKLAEQEPYKAVAMKDLGYFMKLYEDKEINAIVSDLIGVPFERMTTEQFADWNRQWLKTWKHPRFQVGYRGLIFQPMVELVKYLKANKFKVYIFTADEAAFLRLVSEELYGIPPENVLGSSIKLKFDNSTEPTKLIRTKEANYLNNWDGKPRLIEQVIGSRPIFAAGNSNGDLQMLQYVAKQDRRSLALLVHHTDEKREYKYDKHTEEVLPAAKKGNWTIIDMAEDWKQVLLQPISTTGTKRARALRPRAIRQARLKQVASSASGHE